MLDPIEFYSGGGNNPIFSLSGVANNSVFLFCALTNWVGTKISRGRGMSIKVSSLVCIGIYM